MSAAMLIWVMGGKWSPGGAVLVGAGRRRRGRSSSQGQVSDLPLRRHHIPGNHILIRFAALNETY